MAGKSTFIICLETAEPELYAFLKWYDAEMGYVAGKFGAVTADLWDDLPEDEYLANWERQILQYIDRAKVFGLEDHRGRQALAKAAATAVAMAAASVRRAGPLPNGGKASGE